MLRIHATCIVVSGQGILLSGPSAAGKSDLALRMIDRGAALVSDDYTELTADEGVLIARAPAALRGKIEVRGLGIQPMACVPTAMVALFVTLDPSPPRLPPEPLFEMLLGHPIRKFLLVGLEPSAPIKLEMMLRTAAEGK